MQDFNTKATQTDNHNNTLTSVSTQTDNHSRSGALEVNTGFSNNPELYWNQDQKLQQQNHKS